MESEPIPESVCELSVLLTNDTRIHLMNRDFRGKDKPTDVLSFAQLDAKRGHVTTLGDLVISLETTARQARQYRVTFEAELQRLLVHGVLHLLGYDHEGVSRREAQRMRREEARLLRLLSVMD